MKGLLQFCLFLGTICWGLSLIVHLISVTGQVVPGGNLVWGLHIALVVVWLPILVLVKRTKWQGGMLGFWNQFLLGCPVWLRRTIAVLFAYAVVNFVFFMITNTSPIQFEIQSAPPPVMRAFSGHWLFLYAAAAAFSFSRLRSI